MSANTSYHYVLIQYIGLYAVYVFWSDFASCNLWIQTSGGINQNRKDAPSPILCLFIFFIHSENTGCLLSINQSLISSTYMKKHMPRLNDPFLYSVSFSEAKKISQIALPSISGVSMFTNRQVICHQCILTSQCNLLRATRSGDAKSGQLAIRLDFMMSS